MNFRIENKSLFSISFPFLPSLHNEDMEAEETASSILFLQVSWQKKSKEGNDVPVETVETVEILVMMFLCSIWKEKRQNKSYP